MKFGVSMFPTDYSVDIREVARAVEGAGLESLWVPEHLHMPRNHSPFPAGGELPTEYSHSLDPFVALAAAAAVTSDLRLGTAICLVIQRDTITLAKEVASLDQLANGRFMFGIGAGWNRPEIENHGTKFSTRWRKMREQILAMKEIWAHDEAEYHGDYVDFDPMWSWPKPIQKPHPPIIMGGDGPFAERGLVEYCDGWLPRPGRSEVPFPERLADVNRRAAEIGRGPLEHTASGLASDPRVIEPLMSSGVARCILRLPSSDAETVKGQIARCAEVARSFR